MSPLHAVLLPALLLARPVRAERSATWDRVKAVRAEEPLPPTPGHRAALRALVLDLLRAAPSGRVPTDAHGRASSLGLVLERDGDRLWLAEPVGAGPGRGNGLLAVHLGPLRAEVLVLAPHPFHDSDTGAVAGKLLDDLHGIGGEDAASGLRAVMLATAVRDAGEDLDPTRQPAHLLQAMSDAIDQALPDPLLVELHGFAPETSPAEGVVSVGLARSGRQLQARAQRVLAAALPATDLRGPDEVPDLAAHANVQGLMLTDRLRFLHVELDASWRQRLRSEPAVRDRLRRALVLLAEDSGPLPQAVDLGQPSGARK